MLRFGSAAIGILGLACGLIGIPSNFESARNLIREVWPAPEPTAPLERVHPPVPSVTPNGSALEIHEVAVVQAHSGNVETGPVAISVAISSDSKVVASGGQDRMVRLWDAATGERLAELAGHKDDVTSVAFHPKSRLLATGSWDLTVRLWDVTDARKPRLDSTINTKNKIDVTGIAFSPDGRFLAVAGGWWVEIYNVENGTHVRDLFVAGDTSVERVAYSPIDGTIVTGGGNTRAEPDVMAGWLWDSGAGRKLASLLEHRSWVRGVAFTHDGKLAITVSFDRFIRFWSIPDGALVKEVDAGVGVNSVAIRPDGTLLAFAEGSQIVLRDGTGSDVRTTLSICPTHEAWSVAFSRNGKTLAAACWQGRVGIWTLPPSA